MHAVFPPFIKGLGLCFTSVFAIMKITVVDDLGFDKKPSLITSKDMYTKSSDPAHCVNLALYRHCHLQDKIM
jgi:hypothetical protein